MAKYSITILITLGFIFFLSTLGFSQNNCPELEEELFYQVQDCSDEATVCFPAPLEDVLSTELEIIVDGISITENYTGCDFDSTIAYSFFTLLGSGDAGPYHLDSWTVNDVTFSGEFQDLVALTDSMNLWDPTGNWEQDALNPISIEGGNLSSTYSDMVIEQLQLPGTYATAGFGYGQTALGTAFDFGVGIHEVIINNTIASCSDTTIVTVACTPTDYINETIYQGLSNIICLDDSDLLGSLESVSSCDEDGNQGNVAFFIDQETLCITYTGNDLGSESTCYVICDDLGICDTTYINVDVILPPEGEVIVETILVGQSSTACLSAEDLMGDNFVVFNDCPSESGENVEFSFENGSLCIEYTGLSIGIDTACIVLTDDLGMQDTVTFYISVIDPVLVNPVAITDSDTTYQNETVMINVLANDTIEFVDDLTILSNPNNGNVYVTMDNLISYEPTEDYCGFDEFQYVVCNNSGCDTASVQVIIVCDEVRVYNGFSPNQDGINDIFRIGGIEAYPNCSVKIFNAWGNLVYSNEEGKGYSNEEGWDGTWDGRHLPDGNYFYMIDLKDETGKNLSGYVLIHR